MLKFRFMKFLVLPLFIFNLNSEEITIRVSTGEKLKIQTNEVETIWDLKIVAAEELNFNIDELIMIYESKFVKDEERISDFLEKEFFLINGEEKAIAKSFPLRNYQILPTDQDKKDIRFVVTTLGDKPLTKIATKYRQELENAKERLEHLHPLRFFQYIFSEDQLIVGMRNIRKRGWVWDEFKDNSAKRLQQESERNNLNDFISEFSNSVNIDVSFVLPYVNNKEWDKFLSILIQKIPRKGESDRYDQ